MMETALDIITRVRNRQNLPPPTALIGSTDPDVLQMTEELHAVCEELRQEGIWTQQKRRFTFETVVGQSQYQLPVDFYAPLPQTFYNLAEEQPLLGPDTDGGFVGMLVSESANTKYTYRIFGADNNPASSGGQFEVQPEPTEIVEVYFEYVTRSMFVPQFWEAGTAYDASANDMVFVNGEIYLCATDITASDTPPSGTDDGQVDDDGTWDHFPYAYERVLADTDLCIFDPDLVRLGLRAKWLEDNGGEWQSAHSEFKSRISQAISRYKGTYVGSFAGRSRPRGYTVPYKNWGI